MSMEIERKKNPAIIDLVLWNSCVDGMDVKRDMFDTQNRGVWNLIMEAVVALCCFFLR